MQLADHLQQTIDAVQLSSRRDVLPTQQKAQIVGGGDWFNLAPQPLNGYAMNPRQQPAIAPFLLLARTELPAHDLAFAFEGVKRAIDGIDGQQQALR